MVGLFDPLMGGLERVLDLRMQQHTLTSSNLANSDTPGFRAHELDLSVDLPEAIQSGGRSGPMSEPVVHELEPPPWSVDGNSVLPEREMSRLSANAVLYSAVTRGLGRRLAILRYAASDGRG